MNIEHNNKPGAEGTAAHTNSTHAPAPPEQTVNARLLYAFLKPFPLTYEEWFSSLKLMTRTAEINMSRNNLEYRGVVSVDGEDAITWRFAHGISLLSYGLPGAVLSIAIRESLAEPFPSIDDFLINYLLLVVAGKYARAHKLHEFLQVDDEFDPWIKRHISAMRMKFRDDYFYVRIKDAPSVPRQMGITIASGRTDRVGDRDATRAPCNEASRGVRGAT